MQNHLFIRINLFYLFCGNHLFIHSIARAERSSPFTCRINLSIHNYSAFLHFFIYPMHFRERALRPGLELIHPLAFILRFYIYSFIHLSRRLSGQWWARIHLFNELIYSFIQWFKDSFIHLFTGLIYSVKCIFIRIYSFILEN